ncbi:hypothetical protein CIK05_11680 [Bdellovibrio sp. qaytius]|nr:hypothetical protein CIK05_11680 [Bdellovibrio sp. qaytius]
MITFMKAFLEHGGFTSYLIVGAGLSLLALTVDRFRYLFMEVHIVTPETSNSIKAQILKKQYTQAVQLCNSSKNTPELEVVKSGLLAVDSGREAMKSALGGAVVEIEKNCTRRLSLIALIASVATLLGLLGTISGLISTFVAIAAADPAKKSELLGLGISEAMNATAAGLVVGITAMVMHTIFVSKTDEIIAKVKKSGYQLVTLVEQSERG